MDPLQKNWLEAQHVRAFLSSHLRGKSDVTKAKYHRIMSKFVTFCCDRYECKPQELDFSTCTEVTDGNGASWFKQIGWDVIKEFLSQQVTASENTIAQMVLRAYFGYLLEYGVVQSIPVPKPQKTQPENSKQHGLPEDEIRRLAVALKESDHPYRFFLIFQLSAGLRVGEVCALRVHDVQQDNKGCWEVSICREAMKGKRARIQPLPDMSSVMKEWMEWRANQGFESEYLFVDKKGNPMKQRRIRDFLKRLALQVGLSPSIGTHDLRRAYATIVDKYIKNQEALPQALGHVASPLTGNVVTRRYVKEPSMDEVTHWVARLTVAELAESLAHQWLEHRR